MDVAQIRSAMHRIDALEKYTPRLVEQFRRATSELGTGQTVHHDTIEAIGEAAATQERILSQVPDALLGHVEGGKRGLDDYLTRLRSEFGPSYVDDLDDEAEAGWALLSLPRNPDAALYRLPSVADNVLESMRRSLTPAMRQAVIDADTDALESARAGQRAIHNGLSRAVQSYEAGRGSHII